MQAGFPLRRSLHSIKTNGEIWTAVTADSETGTGITEHGDADAGTLAVASLGTGDVGVSPQGAPHYVKNNGKLAADILLVFTGAADSGIDLAGVLGS